ncbi:ECF transporter S component [Irregularibacter muris]|uniref:ECF transporter S component n=1 Tax=Irregularibacter muris TaxID=1796619 RepID=A0AAE3KZF7_9FIRM|nr:ECF transporter S component [Irregularibacter muris]MCR1898232.1 ECF transporter S component [Irregularibacter muris]
MQVQSKKSHLNKKKYQLLSWIILLLGIPIVILLGVKLFNDRKYNLISIIIAFFACVPFFLQFERRKPRAREVMVIAVMSAISVTGRLIFAVLPGFKPVTAITAITGIALGPETGFLTGAISAIASNMFFGQGPWTPFQMLSWGLMGFIAGILGKFNIMQNKIILSLYGIFSGILYSLLMDIWFVLSIDGLFSWDKYIFAIASALPFMVIYALSNVFFLLLFSRPLGEKLQRMKTKYGLME